MKKSKKLFALLLCSTMLFAGCSGSADQETEAETNAAADTEIVTRGEFTASDYCTITEYKGLKFAEKDIAASEEDIQSEVDNLIESATELKDLGEDVAAENGHVVNIDYTGYLDGETFEGGTGTGYDLELGSGSFISGFEDGLVGAKKGEEKELNLTFPETYENNPDMAGKDVVFKVTVNSVQAYTTPEYTDELVAANTEYKTTDEYEKAIAAEIRENNLATVLADQLFANAEFTEEYPESLQEYYETMYISSYESMVQSYYGMTLDEYLEAIGETQETFLEEMGIEGTIQSDLILCAVAEQEGIVAEGEGYEAFLAEEAESRSIEVEELIEQYGDEELEFAYILNTAYELIYNSIVVE